MYAVIRRYQFDQSNSKEINHRVSDIFLRLISNSPDFIDYFWLDSGEDKGDSLSVFRDKIGAMESVRIAAKFVEQHLGLLLEEPELIQIAIRAGGTALAEQSQLEEFEVVPAEVESPYNQAYYESINNPDEFWGEAAEQVVWIKKWDKVLDDTCQPFYRWFTGGIVNTCYNALDRHVDEGNGNRQALIYDSPVAGNFVRKFTYRELRDQVAKFAGVLTAQGVSKGDRVIIYMPMVPEAAVAMLACARIGAVHSVVFGGLAAKELAVRINDAKPKVIVSASCGLEPNRIVDYKRLLDNAIELSEITPDKSIILQRRQHQCNLNPAFDLDWDEQMAAATAADCVPVEATDPLYILYTSGTTGVARGVLRDNGGHLVALKWSMKNIYNIEPGDVYWAASDIGGVIGHSYIIYAPLINGNTTIIYEGKPVGTPDAGAFWRVIADHNVRVLFTAPTSFRSIKREDPNAELMQKYDLSSLQALYLAGERTDPDTLEWAQQVFQRPVIDHWWQTETGWAIAANCMGLEPLPVKPGSPTKAVPGYDVRILDEEGEEQEPGEFGRIMIKLPLPPGCLITLWQNDERYVDSYLSAQPGYYLTGDAGLKDADGYLFIMSRIDDIINVAGHRLSTGVMEEVLSSHPDVYECAVIGAADKVNGEMPVGIVVLKAGVERDAAEILKELIALVREKIGPVAAFEKVTIVERLPKTRSGKILRGTMKRMADGEKYKMPATIDDPDILLEITEALEELAYTSSR